MGEENHCFLCRGCAESNDNIKMIRPVTDKGKCLICRRRCYGYLCEVMRR